MTTSSPQGFAVIPRWLLYSPSFTPAAKIVYLVVQSHTDEHGESYPGIRKIATESGYSRSTVKRALDDLKLHGLVTVEGRKRVNGGTTTNLYRVATIIPRM